MAIDKNMDERQALILKTIIAEHVKTGVPVSSAYLVDNYNLDISSATVRNVMMALEEAGYIYQPHTSAGRVPTEKAYKWYIQGLSAEQVPVKDQRQLQATLGSAAELELMLKKTAKFLAASSGLAAFCTWRDYNVYCTGISNLLINPELVFNFSNIVDSLDEIISNNQEYFEDEPKILVGSDGPFGNFCSAVVSKYKLGEHTGVFGLLGPLRIDYARSLALMKYVKANL